MSSAPTGSPIQKVLAALSGVVEDGDGKWKAYCPIHESDGGQHDPSLYVTEASDGKVLTHCMVCGDNAPTPKIVHALGMTMSELFPDHSKFAKRDKKNGRPSGMKKISEFQYRDADGIVVYKTERWESPDGDRKTFSQSRPNGQGGWHPGTRGIERVLYRLPELIATPKDQPVYIVEGEKKVECLVKWGLTATCNVGGAGKWKKEYGKFFRGRPVIILPDNDPVNQETGRKPGIDHARDIIESMKEIAASVRVLELPGLPPKGDIVDWIADGGTLPKLLELLQQPDAGTADAVVVAAGGEATQSPDDPEIVGMDPLALRAGDRSLNDIANGRRLVKKHGKDIRFCHPWGKWIVWDGKRWKVDDTGEVHRRAKDVSGDLWEECGKLRNDVSDMMRAKINGFCRSTASSSGLGRMAECAASEPGAQILPGQLDANPWLLNVQNGTIDLQTGELRPHCQDDLLTKISPVVFDPDAVCPRWEGFLVSVFEKPEMIAYLQRLCGYWATGVIREQSLPILWGHGSNGKTTFLNAIMEVLGKDYAMKSPSNFLMAKVNDAHPTDKADLFGRRMVTCSETEDGKRLDESLVKELTGDEPIRARRMREDFWEFNPTHKILLVTNHLPRIRGTDHGIWRRIRRIPFIKKYWNPAIGETGPEELRQDDTLKDDIKNEYQGVLSWIIRGTLSWLHDGEQAPSEVAGSTGEYRSQQDVLGTFVEELCSKDQNAVCEAAELYKTYKKWADETGEYCLPQRQFGMAMTERGFERYKNNGVWYRGICLATSVAFE